jgi:hypothetical protein
LSAAPVVLAGAVAGLPPGIIEELSQAAARASQPGSHRSFRDA